MKSAWRLYVSAMCLTILILWCLVLFGCAEGFNPPFAKPNCECNCNIENTGLCDADE